MMIKFVLIIITPMSKSVRTVFVLTDRFVVFRTTASKSRATRTLATMFIPSALNRTTFEYLVKQTTCISRYDINANRIRSIERMPLHFHVVRRKFVAPNCGRPLWSGHFLNIDVRINFYVFYISLSVGG